MTVRQSVQLSAIDSLFTCNGSGRSCLQCWWYDLQCESKKSPPCGFL